MTDVLTDAVNSQFLGIPTIFIILVMVGIIVLVWKRKPQKKEFKQKSAEQEIKAEYKELIKMTGVKVNKKLMQGFACLGQVGKCSKKGENEKVYHFYFNPLALPKRRLGLFKHYTVIPNDAIVGNSPKELHVSNDYEYNNDFGVLTFGKLGKERVYDEGYKVNSENQINSLINWLPLQTYLSVQHAQGSEELDHIAKIEKEHKDEAIRKMTGKDKK